MKSYKTHVRNDRIKWVIVSVALLLVAVILCGIMTSWFKEWNPYCWFGHNYEAGKCTRCGADKETPAIKDTANSGVAVSNVNGKRMALSVRRAANSASDGYTLTAAIKPATADDKRVDWSIGWKNPNSTWATGKNVSDYITITPTAEHALTANLDCSQAFGEQVIVTVTSLDNAEAKATCTVDFVPRVLSATFNMPKVTSQTATITYNTELSVGTVEATTNVTLSNFQFVENFLRDYCQEFDQGVAGVQGASDIFWDDTTKTHIKYTSSGIEFINGGTYQSGMDFMDTYFPEGLIGCFFSFNGQDVYEDRFSVSDMIYVFRTILSQKFEEFGKHASFDATFTTVYNGKTFSTVTKSVPVIFDGEAFRIPVEQVTLSETGVVL